MSEYMYKPMALEELCERGKAQNKTAAKNLRDLAGFLEQHPELYCDKVKIEVGQTAEYLRFTGSFIVHREACKATVSQDIPECSARELQQESLHRSEDLGGRSYCRGTLPEGEQ